MAERLEVFFGDSKPRGNIERLVELGLLGDLNIRHRH